MLDLIKTQGDISLAIDRADSLINKKYLSNLSQYALKELPEELQALDLNKIARFYKLEQFVFSQNEDNRDKLASVFQAVASVGASLVFIIESNKRKINYYIGVKSPGKNLALAYDVLYKSLSGNFPGIVFQQYENMQGKNAIMIKKSDLEELERDIFERSKLANQERSISVVTGVAGLRAEKKGEQRFIQGIERVIDAMHGEKYALMIIADPISNDNFLNLKRSYENLYSDIKPLETMDINLGENSNYSLARSYSQSVSESINQSVTDTVGSTKTTSTSTSHSSSKSTSQSVSFGFLRTGTSFSQSESSSTTHSRSESHAESQSQSQTTGSTHGTTDTRGISDTASQGVSQSVQLKFQNKVISEILKKIDLQLERLQKASDLGMWNVATYCIADNQTDSKALAAAYQSVIRGENSGLETSAITTWSDKNLQEAERYLKKLFHPLIDVEGSEVQSGSLVTSQELTIHAGFPERSVTGFGVKHLASFGREVMREHPIKRGIHLGDIYHMGRSYDSPVELDLNSLSGHTFITGSTGSGKSNTIYEILGKAKKNGVKFLVIEPTKGEYKHVFGHQDDVNVYGTNASLTPLLRINPFKFSKQIHILEHLDRLTEIFNVCWPMYAAMPAILKKALERSYEEAGWDLMTSQNSVSESIFPDFADVMQNVIEIVGSSEYSDENKGNYKGALVTRLESLTNGINGLIFTNQDLEDETLFEQNTIIDLSRIGSSETKALIMGILIMKLVEYRLSSAQMNADLKHICVLEEAHNLLKRTSFEQSSEGANLIGKSVEMLANSIAEMRTYGEGFIIADQSPGLLDMSAIRNTNTKIILRTPDFSDRELVGRAAGLNEEQIADIVKLPKGVAVVYQNEWIEAVLCRVNRANCSDEARYEQPDRTILPRDDRELKNRIIKALLAGFIHQKPESTLAELKDEILDSRLSSRIKAKLLGLSKGEKQTNLRNAAPIIASFFENADEVVQKIYNQTKEIKEYNELLTLELCINESLKDYSGLILQCITNEIGMRHQMLNDLPYHWNQFMNQGGIK